MNLLPNAHIHIKDLKVQAVIGTLAHERGAPQELCVNIFFEYDAALSAQTDALGHAVDYAAIHARIVERVSTTKFFLLERLAAFILQVIGEDPKVVAATVTIGKAGALAGAAVVLSMSANGQMRPASTARCY